MLRAILLSFYLLFPLFNGYVATVVSAAETGAPDLEKLSPEQLIALARKSKTPLTDRMEALDLLLDQVEAAQQNPSLAATIFRLTASGQSSASLPASDRIQNKLLAGLVELLKEPELELREQSVEVIAAFGEHAREALSQLLKHYQEDIGLRHALVWMFGSLRQAGKETIPILRMALEDPSLRLGAVYSLGELGPLAQTELKLLIPYLKSEIVELQRQTVQSIGKIGCPDEAIEDLVLLSKSIDGETARTALQALATYQGANAAALEVLNKKLFDVDEQQRSAALNSLNAWGSRATPAAPAIAKLLREDASRRMVIKAAQALQELKSDRPEVLEQLKLALGSTRITTRIQAIRVLETLGEAGADILIQAAAVADIETRKQLEHALARLRAAENVKPVQSLPNDHETP